MNGFIPRFAFWNPGTWTVPTLYWEDFSDEQRYHAICRELGKAIRYIDYLGVNVNDIAERLKAIEDGQLDPIIIEAINTWFAEHEPEIVAALQALNDALPISDFDEEHTVKDELDAANDAITELQTKLEADEKTLDRTKFIDNAYKQGFWRNTYFQQYFAATPPANEYSTMQSVADCGSTLVFVQGPASYWGNSIYSASISNTVRVSEINKDSGVITRTQISSGFYHSNSMTYDTKRNVFYNVDMYELTNDGTIWKNTIGIIDYDTLQRIDEFVPVPDATYFDGIGYNETTDTIALFSFDKFSEIFYAYIVDAETHELLESIRLEEFEALYGMLAYQYNRTPGQFFQSAKQTENYFMVACYHPAIIVISDKQGHIFKIVRIDDTEISNFELEDFTFDEETGECFVQTHKRYYNRKTSGGDEGEVHEDIENIYRCNLYTNVPNSFMYEDATGWNVFYVDPSTTNTIQNGTVDHPFKSVMEGLNILDLETYSPRFYLVGSGSVPWIRIVDQHLNIVKTSESTVTVGCVYARDSDVYLESIEFEDVTGFLNNRYDDYGDIVFLNGCHVVINGGVLPTGSDEYIVVNRSIMQCESSTIADDSNVAFRFTNASIGAISSSVASKCTKSATCMINQTIS